MELENILTEEMNPVLQELISWSVKRPHTQVHDWPPGLILDTPVKCEHKTKFSDIVSFLLHCSRSRTRKGIKALVLFFPPPQGSVAKGERTYFVKRLCENTEEKRPTQSHTQPETHTLHKPTLKNVDKLFFFRSADQLQLSWHLILTKPEPIVLSIKHSPRYGRAPEGPGPRAPGSTQTRHTSLTSPLPCNPHSTENENRRTDDFFFCFHSTQTGCQNSKLNHGLQSTTFFQTPHICHFKGLPICIEATFHTVC